MTASTYAPPATTSAEPPRRNSTLFPHNKPAWVFIAPFALFYLAFLVWPTLYMFITSFFSTSIVKPGLGPFAGLENYREVLTSRGFWLSMWHTVQFTIYTTPPLVVLAFLFAVLVNRLKRGQTFFRVAFFVPFILPSATIALIWLFIFTPASGLWPLAQGLVGVDAPQPVLATPSLAMLGIAAATVWWTLGFNFILYLAALQDIPRETYEAASVDGASPLQQIRFITIPLLSKTTTLVLVLQIIASLKIFDQVALMTPGGGPGGATEVALTYIADTAFTDFRVGAASTASVVLFIVIIIIAALRQLTERSDRTA